MHPTETQFLSDLNGKIWTAANKLLPMLDAAVYNHAFLGLIFLKYVSDAFKEGYEEQVACAPPAAA
ncbi:MAG: type I restriction-modification system subunit M N-terminal domain-containing protein [Nitrospira sp.]|nr:type I restriction-modification system subunit M N-terminal domain-containing protein [Nitrospira sp.]